MNVRGHLIKHESHHGGESLVTQRPCLRMSLSCALGLGDLKHLVLGSKEDTS